MVRGGVPGLGGVSAPRGVCLVWGDVPGLGGCLSLGGAWSGGGCLVREGGVSGLGGVPGPGRGVSQHALRQTPLPPVDRHTLVKTLP